MKNNVYFFLFATLIFCFITGCQTDTNSGNNTGTENTSAPTTTTQDPPKEKTKFELIQGRWQDVNNEDRYVIFTKDKMITRVDGKIEKTVIFVYNSPCLSKFQSYSDDDVSTFDCFMETSRRDGGVVQRIYHLDETTLEYAMLDGSGERVVMRKVQ